MDYYKTRSMALSIIAAVSCRHFQQCFPVLLKIFQQQGDLTLAQAEQLCQAPLGQGICHTAASLFAAAAPVGEPQAQDAPGRLPIRCAVQKDLERILCRKLICHHPYRQGTGLAGSQPCRIQDPAPAAARQQGQFFPSGSSRSPSGRRNSRWRSSTGSQPLLWITPQSNTGSPAPCQGLVSTAAELQLSVILPGCELLDLCIQKRRSS